MVLILLALFAAEQPLPDEFEVLKLALQVMGLVGAVLAGLGAAIGFFLTRYWNTRDKRTDQRERELAARDADQARLRDILYESLKWFEGGTQNRSIGIAVVSTSWDTYTVFQPLWLEVLANQAIYLLAASNEKTKAHEHENLRRIMGILVREKDRLDSTTAELLCTTLRDKQSGSITEGLTLTKDLNKRIGSWFSELCAQTTPTDIQSGKGASITTGRGAPNPAPAHGRPASPSAGEGQ